MKNISNFSIVLIGFSYTFLIINKIAFGITIGLSVLILLNKYKSIIVKELKVIIIKDMNKLNLFLVSLFLLSFFFSTLKSIEIYRSLLVFLYLILFIIFSLLIYFIFHKKKYELELLLKSLSLSILFNSVLIFIYNITNYNSGELVMFKGYMNILSLITILNLYLLRSRLNFISTILLIPNIFMTGSAASILGILFGTIFCVIYLLFKKYINSLFFKNFLILFSFLILIISSSIFLKNLPSKFDIDSMTSFEYKIPINLLDVHRQIIWGFTFNKFKDKPLFGYGPDSSNFIEGSQKDIGIQMTGDMNFIPSHPHNFFFELLLETGLVGTMLFILFLVYVNLKVSRINDSVRFNIFLIFLNAYFWGSSLVNFSFWLGWWQGSYYLLLSILASRGFQEK